MANTVVNTSKLAAVRGGAHIYSAIYDTDLMNGAVGYIGELDANTPGQETYEFGVFDADTLNKKKVVLVSLPEWSYQSGRSAQALDAYINKAGIPFRAFDLIDNDIFHISVGGINASDPAAIKVGAYVTVAANSTQLNVVANEQTAAANNFYGIIETKKIDGMSVVAKNGTTYGKPMVLYGIRVLKNV